MYAEDIIKAVFAFALAAILTVAAAFLMAFPVMWCYNGVFPSLFGLPVMEYSHAVSLYIFVGLFTIKAETSN